MTLVQRLYRRSKLYGMLHPRRMHVFCAGTGKSGTTSLAAMFADTATSAHEPDARRLLRNILRYRDKEMSPRQWQRFVLTRDRELWLEVDSSQLNSYLLNVLVPAFPAAKFILTIRDCYSWLDSQINHQLSEENLPQLWARLRDVHFRADELTHPDQEKPLKDRGLFTLDGYFSHWAQHNQTVLDTVPPDRLLVVRTNEISAQAGAIAQFVGAPLSEEGKTHFFKARAKHNVLSEIDPDYLQRKADQYCRPIMDRFFPTTSLGVSLQQSGAR